MPSNSIGKLAIRIQRRSDEVVVKASEGEVTPTLSNPLVAPTEASFYRNTTYGISDIIMKPVICPNTSKWKDCYYASIPKDKNGKLEWTCPAGSFCLSPSDKAPCTPGFFCPENSQQPVYCASRYFCSNDTTTIQRCPRDHFCPTGTVEPLSCGITNTCQEGSESAPRVFILPIFVGVVIVVLFLFAAKKRGEQSRRLKHAKEIQTVFESKNGSPLAEGVKSSSADDNDESAVSLASGDVQSMSSRGNASDDADADAVLNVGEVTLDPVQRTFDIDFENLSCRLSNGLQILQSVSGSAHHGRTMAIMGPSGAGKTTLINVLSGKLKKCSGSVRVNGKSEELSTYKRLMGFVPQDDIMLKELTVRDILMHSAQMRLPADMSFCDKRYKVLETAAFLGLNNVFDSVIGDENKRGISGGQRKRVNIGMELVTEPSIIILDEPTSGLDSSTATDICKLLRSISRRKKITVMAIIHSPPPMSFNQFDDLILLGKNGICAYSGPRDRAEEYFARSGFYMAEGETLADFLLEIVTGKVSCAFDPSFSLADLGILWEQYGSTFLKLPKFSGPFPHRTEISADSPCEMQQTYFKPSYCITEESESASSDYEEMESHSAKCPQVKFAESCARSSQSEREERETGEKGSPTALLKGPPADMESTGAQRANTLNECVVSSPVDEIRKCDVRADSGDNSGGEGIIGANASVPSLYGSKLQPPQASDVSAPGTESPNQPEQDLSEYLSDDSLIGTDTTLNDKLRKLSQPAPQSVDEDSQCLISGRENSVSRGGSRQRLHHRHFTQASGTSSASYNNLAHISDPKVQRALLNNPFGPDVFLLRRNRGFPLSPNTCSAISESDKTTLWKRVRAFFTRSKKNAGGPVAGRETHSKSSLASCKSNAPTTNEHNDPSSTLHPDSAQRRSNHHRSQSKSRMNSLNLMLRPSFTSIARPIIQHHPRKGLRKIYHGAIDLCRDFIHWNKDVYDEFVESLVACKRSLSGKKNPIRRTPSFFKVFLLAFQRATLQILRSPGPFVLNCLTHMGSGIFISVATQNFTYLGAQPSSLCDTAPLNLQWACRNPTDNVREAGMFFCLGALFAAMSSAVSTFGNERVVFWRDTSAGMPTLPYFLAKSIADWPRLVLGAFLYSLGFTIFYPYRSSYSNLLVIAILVYLAAFNMGYFVSMFARRENVALVCTGFALGWALVFAGVIPDLYDVMSDDSAYHSISFIWQISAPRWAVEALWIKEVRARPFIEIFNKPPNHAFYSWDAFDQCLRNVGLIALGWSVASFLSLKLLRRSKFR